MSNQTTDPNSIIDRLTKALKPIAPGAHWTKFLKSERKKVRIAFDGHGYELGRISHYDTEVTADETWIAGSACKDFPRLTPKMAFQVKVTPVGPTRIAIMIYVRPPRHMNVMGPTQALLASREFEGKSIKVGLRNAGSIDKATIQTREIKQNGARWIEIDRPLEQIGPDMVAAFPGFGK
jgi:hypothetical protein